MSETYTVTLVADPETASDLVDIDLTEVRGVDLIGDAEVDLEEVLDEAIANAQVTDTDAPPEIAQAINLAVGRGLSATED